MELLKIFGLGGKPESPRGSEPDGKLIHESVTGEVARFPSALTSEPSAKTQSSSSELKPQASAASSASASGAEPETKLPEVIEEKDVNDVDDLLFSDIQAPIMEHFEKRKLDRAEFRYMFLKTGLI